MKNYKKTLFIFRRDLRLEDNTALIEALEKSEVVIPCFIFDPRQITEQNKYISTNAIQFMIESLQDLDAQLEKKDSQLYIFEGVADEVVQQLIKKEKIDAVFVNRDYTPFSIKRDQAIQKVCLHEGIAFQSCADLLLNEPETILTGNGTPFSIFTPFWRKAITIPVRMPKHLPRGAHLYSKPIAYAASSKIFKKILPHENKAINQHGGRKEGLNILHSIAQFKNYKQTRDIPALKTTELSAHHKFGTISIRESYYAMQDGLGKGNELSRQLYWRDFFTHLAYNSPFVFGQPFHEKYAGISWNKSKADFERWCTGTTGFPLVDAGMRQLNTTGWMHNRVRMVVASFLTKDLHINWTWGEQYFARMLIDYDPAVNNGNWQWAASTGADAQPYFRIFNPWLQQKKFDPECMYIKTWIPELKKIDPKIIHKLYNPKSPHIAHYQRPMVDHDVEQRRAKQLYKVALNAGEDK